MKLLKTENRKSIDASYTALEQVVACAPVTQRARVRSLVGTSFLGEVFSRFFLTYTTNIREFYAPWFPEYHLAIKIIHYGRQWPLILTCPKTQIFCTIAVPTRGPWKIGQLMFLEHACVCCVFCVCVCMCVCVSVSINKEREIEKLNILTHYLLLKTRQNFIMNINGIWWQPKKT